MNKPTHKPQKVSQFGETLDSKFEADIHRKLRECIYKNASLKVHQRILYKPACDVFPARFWNCDFQLFHYDRHLNIEAKGFVAEDFLLKVACLEYSNYHEFSLLKIVIPNGMGTPRSWRPLWKAGMILRERELSDFLEDWMRI